MVVHLSVAAGPATDVQQHGGHQTAQQQAAKGAVPPVAPPPAAAAAAAGPAAGAAMRPIPAPRGYRSLMQFGQINEVYYSK